MKILYIHQYFKTPQDAGGTRSYYFAKRLTDHGHNVTMLTSNTNNKDFPFIKHKNVESINVIYIKNAYDNKMGKKGKNFVEENYNWENEGKNY